MFKRIKKHLKAQTGGFLANYVNFGLSAALYTAPFYFSRQFVREEVLEPSSSKQQSSKSVFEKILDIVKDFSVLTASKHILDMITPFLPAVGFAASSGAFRGLVMGALFRKVNDKDALSKDDLLRDFVQGAGRAYFIHQTLQTLLAAGEYTQDDDVPAVMLATAGVVGECMLHNTKQLYQAYQASRTKLEISTSTRPETASPTLFKAQTMMSNA